jgi:hypothetical protein
MSEVIRTCFTFCKEIVLEIKERFKETHPEEKETLSMRDRIDSVWGVAVLVFTAFAMWYFTKPSDKPITPTPTPTTPTETPLISFLEIYKHEWFEWGLWVAGGILLLTLMVFLVRYILRNKRTTSITTINWNVVLVTVSVFVVALGAFFFLNTAPIESLQKTSLPKMEDIGPYLFLGGIILFLFIGGRFLKPVLMVGAALGAVWLYEPENTLVFIKNYYDTAGLFFISAVAFFSAKKEVEAINMWTLPLGLYVIIFLGSAVLGFLSMFNIRI